jgi:hypothetical protein
MLRSIVAQGLTAAAMRVAAMRASQPQFTETAGKQAGQASQLSRLSDHSSSSAPSRTLLVMGGGGHRTEGDRLKRVL